MSDRVMSKILYAHIWAYAPNMVVGKLSDAPLVHLSCPSRAPLVPLSCPSRAPLVPLSFQSCPTKMRRNDKKCLH